MIVWQHFSCLACMFLAFVVLDTAALAPPKVDKGFNLLETASQFFPQGRIVGITKETWRFVWKRMMTELAPQDDKGAYQRPKYLGFRGKIGDRNFPDESGRYQLYVGNPCPWCHRARLAVTVRQNTNHVGITTLVDDPIKASRGGWVFSSSNDLMSMGCKDLRQLYEKLMGGTYTGRCTAPLLVDKKSRTIVSNESADIVRMLLTAKFGSASQEGDSNDIPDLYPADLADSINETNDWVYEYINNGVYQCGFCTSQEAYNEASKKVRTGLGRCNEILKTQNYLCSDKDLTEADLRLLPTILRYDGVYSPLFRAGGAHLRIVSNFPYIHKWLKRCWSIPGVKESIDLQDACESYYRQLFPLNAGGILPSPVTANDLGLE